MTRLEQLAAMGQRVRGMLREVYVHGAARINHSDLAMCLGRERATKGFYADIKNLWVNEMELLGYGSRDMPGLQYCWVAGVNEWLFVFIGKTAEDKLEWTII